MKKFAIIGMLALAATALPQQQASAWVNCKFGIGLNIGFSCGGNSWLWGAFRNGQPGEPDCTGHGCSGHGFATFDAYPPAFPVADFIPPMPTPVSQGRTWYTPDFQPVNFAPAADSSFFFLQ